MLQCSVFYVLSQIMIYTRVHALPINEHQFLPEANTGHKEDIANFINAGGNLGNGIVNGDRIGLLNSAHATNVPGLLGGGDGAHGAIPPPLITSATPHVNSFNVPAVSSVPVAVPPIVPVSVPPIAPVPPVPPKSPAGNSDATVLHTPVNFDPSHSVRPSGTILQPFVNFTNGFIPTATYYMNWFVNGIGDAFQYAANLFRRPSS